jgi:hypothetical protein
MRRDSGPGFAASHQISNAIVPPLAGWFSTVFGRKRLYMF